MIVRIYLDSVAPANLVDTVESNLQGKLFGSIGDNQEFYTRAIRSKTISFPTPAAGTHKFLFTIQLASDEVPDAFFIPANRAVIQAQLVTSAP